MDEQNLLQSIIQNESWEDMIYQIVTLEGINPWDIDIEKLTDSFLKYIEDLKLVDFRIPAKVVVVAALLLKLKAESLFPRSNVPQEFQVETPSNLDEFLQLRMKLSGLNLSPPMERLPKRAVTLEELVNALRKAIKVNEKKDTRKRTLGRRIANNINLEEEDIETRINRLMNEIDGFLSKLKGNKVGFTKIVENWEREEIVKHFLPLLYLSSRGKVETDQEEFFKEIWIFRKGV